jgi:hypothetical protein
MDKLIKPHITRRVRLASLAFRIFSLPSRVFAISGEIFGQVKLYHHPKKPVS